MKYLKAYSPSVLFKKRNFGLDLIRTIAIGLVMISHLGIQPEYVGGLRIGQLGVEVFFVLSGFLIGQILIKDFSNGINLSVILHFWKRRWYRTLPLYYLIIILKFIFIDHSLGYKIIVYFFFLQNNFVGIDFMGVTWSLVIEEWFYLSLPLMLFVYFYFQKITPKKLMYFILLFCFLENVLRLVWVLYSDRGYEAINGNFPFRLDSMMCGVFIANLRLNFNHYYQFFTKTYVFITTLIIYSVLLYVFGMTNLNEGALDELLWTRTIWFFSNSLLLAFFIPYFETFFKNGVNYKNPIYTIITYVSIFSYAVYLIHQEIYHYILLSELFSTAWLIESIVAILLTFLISGILFVFYEKPMTDLRDRFSKRKVLK